MSVLANKIRERYAAIRAIEKQAEERVRELRNMVSFEIMQVRLREKRDVIEELDQETKLMLTSVMSNYPKIWLEK